MIKDNPLKKGNGVIKKLINYEAQDYTPILN